MIARPGRPGIHDGTEFALQGFKNLVGEAAACVPERWRVGNPTDDRFRGTSSGASQSAMLLTSLIAEGLLRPSEILGTMFIAADCLGMNTKEDAMDLNGKKIAILATNGFEQADSKCHGTG
jgi:hypothetical protein